MKKKKYPLLIGVLITFCLMSVLNVFAHPGRTDASGGHWNHSTGEYHYHTGEYAGRNQSSSNTSSKLEELQKKHGITGKYRGTSKGIVHAVKGAVREMDSSVPLPPENAEESAMTVLLVPFLVIVGLYFLFVKIFRKRNDSMQNTAKNAQEGKKSIPGTRLSDLVEKYGPIQSDENPRTKALLIVFRNILSIIIGLITYVIMEALTAHIFLFLLKIPVLSFFMTGGHIVSVDRFLIVSVASASVFATAYIVRLISSYKSTNYSIVIVFLILLIFYIVAFISEILVTGFDFSKLISALIFIGSYIVGCSLANE